jgi:hypothetical protein
VVLGRTAGRSAGNRPRNRARRRFTDEERRAIVHIKDDPNTWPLRKTRIPRFVISAALIYIGSVIYTSLWFITINDPKSAYQNIILMVIAAAVVAATSSEFGEVRRHWLAWVRDR